MENLKAHRIYKDITTGIIRSLKNLGWKVAEDGTATKAGNFNGETRDFRYTFGKISYTHEVSSADGWVVLYEKSYDDIPNPERFK